jgi:HTH-type transcriptional regulator, cell division transcriptional repressor
MSLGERVRQRREELALSQEELAALIGMKQTVLSRIERGVNTNPHKDVLLRLARTLRCSIDWLVGLYDEPAHAYTLALSSSPAS